MWKNKKDGQKGISRHQHKGAEVLEDRQLYQEQKGEKVMKYLLITLMLISSTALGKINNIETLVTSQFFTGEWKNAGPTISALNVDAIGLWFDYNARSSTGLQFRIMGKLSEGSTLASNTGYVMASNIASSNSLGIVGVNSLASVYETYYLPTGSNSLLIAVPKSYVAPYLQVQIMADSTTTDPAYIRYLKVTKALWGML